MEIKMIRKKTSGLRSSTRFTLMFAVFFLSLFGAMNLFERILLKQVQEVTEAANVAFTRFFVNETWKDLRPLLDIEAKVATKSNPLLGDAEMRVRRFAKGTDLVKVKIYNLQGLTVYSSDHAQIGEDKANNKGFQSAVHGRVVSETNYRGKFGAFDGELYDRNLVSSYVPVRSSQGIEAVVEVYADRTSSIERVEAEIRHAWWYIGPGMGVAFLIVWLLTKLGQHELNSRTAGAKDRQLLGQENDAPNNALLHEAAQVFNEDRELLICALPTQSVSAPDHQAWQTLREPLISLLDHIEAFCLIHQLGQEKSNPQAENQQTLEEMIDSTISSLRQRNASQGIEITVHLSTQLTDPQYKFSPDVARLLKLLLGEATKHNGPGKIRLNIQPVKEGLMQIEIVGNRSIAAPEQETAETAHSLRLRAARALAAVLNGQIERISFASSGPWFSARLPVTR